MRGRRLLAWWCAATFVAAAVVAVVDQPAPATRVASTGGDRAADDGTTTTTPIATSSSTATTKPTSTTAAGATPPTSVPGVRDASPVPGSGPRTPPPPPLPRVPLADRPGAWLVAADGSGARWLGDMSCTRRRLEWRPDGSGFFYSSASVFSGPPAIREQPVAGAARDVSPITADFVVAPGSGRVARSAFEGGPPGGILVTDGDLASHPVLVPFELQYLLGALAFSPDGQRLAITGETLQVVRADDGTPVQSELPMPVDADGGLSGDVVWTSDGRWLVLDGFAPAAMDVATGEVRRLPAYQSAGTARPGPGSLMLFGDYTSTGHTLELIDVATGSERVLVPDHVDHGWSRRGGFIAWSGGPEPGLHTISPDGTPGPDLLAVGTRTVTEASESWQSSFGIQTISFSPDGTQIAVGVC